MPWLDNIKQTTDVHCLLFEVLQKQCQERFVLSLLHFAGSESDWVLDLVATGFEKDIQLFGHTMRTTVDVDAAADAFKGVHTKVGYFSGTTGVLVCCQHVRHCRPPSVVEHAICRTLYASGLQRNIQ